MENKNKKPLHICRTRSLLIVFVFGYASVVMQYVVFRARPFQYIYIAVITVSLLFYNISHQWARWIRTGWRIVTNWFAPRRGENYNDPETKRKRTLRINPNAYWHLVVEVDFRRNAIEKCPIGRFVLGPTAFHYNQPISETVTYSAFFNNVGHEGFGRTVRIVMQ